MNYNIFKFQNHLHVPPPSGSIVNLTCCAVVLSANSGLAVKKTLPLIKMKGTDVHKKINL